LLQWVGGLDRADHLIEESKRTCPDIVILDVDMPGADVFEVLPAMQNQCPNVRVIMLTSYSSPEHIDRAFAAGAWGFVSKLDQIDTLMDGIQAVMRGELYFSPMVQGVSPPKPGPSPA
jgi:two-component system response regulator DesR